MDTSLGNILIVDDNPNVLSALSQLFEPEFDEVFIIGEPEMIPGILAIKNIDLVLMDMNFEPGDSSGKQGLMWLQRVLEFDPDCVVVMMTAYGEYDLAVKAIKGGANDFIVKPWNNDKLLTTLKSGMKLRFSKAELTKLKNKQKLLNREISGSHVQMIGKSKSMLHLKRIIKKVAATDSSILILGENGSGKDLIAREIHCQSHRKDEVFVHVDMGAISDTLFESELFGHTKGAYTDASSDRAGRFEVASGGTLFMDEIGNLSLKLQSKLLNVIQNREIYRMGSNKPVPVDIRIIAATNQDIKAMIDKKLFREDLYYRINTIEIETPPLRERSDDILLLANAFLDEFSKKYNKKVLKFSRAYLNYLKEQEWPGNVRQLRNLIEKDLILSDTDILDIGRKSNISTADLYKTDAVHTLAFLQKDKLEETLNRNNGNIAKSSEELGLARSTIYNMIKKYEIRRK